MIHLKHIKHLLQSHEEKDPMHVHSVKRREEHYVLEAALEVEYAKEKTKMAQDEPSLRPKTNRLAPLGVGNIFDKAGENKKMTKYDDCFLVMEVNLENKAAC